MPEINPPTSLPLVSIIILNFNGKDWLAECLESIEKLCYPKDRLEVILGDNASADGSIEYVNQSFPWVKTVRFERNYGFCKSNNQCAEHAKGEYVVFLNNDTFVDENWLMELVRGALSEPGIISCASKIFFPHLDGGKILNAAGGYIFSTGGGLYEGWMDQDGAGYNVQKYTGFGCGAGVLVQKKFFLETGGFDEYYFYSCEEMDLGFRVWLHEYKVLYVPTAIMYHYMGKTGFRGKGMTPTIVFLIIRNNLYFIFKNFEGVTAFWGFLLFNIKTVYSILHSLRYFNYIIPVYIFRGYLSFFKDIPKILKARKQTQMARKVNDQELLRLGILVSARDVIRLGFVTSRNIQKQKPGCIYDTKDAVKVKIDENGDFIFYKPS